MRSICQLKRLESALSEAVRTPAIHDSGGAAFPWIDVQLPLATISK